MPVVKTKYKNFKLTSKFIGDIPALCNKNNYNRHRICVTNVETGYTCEFNFWASIASPVIKTEWEVLEAFNCFLSDAVSGCSSFGEFLSDFGYEKVKESSRTYNLCVKAKNQALKLFQSSEETLPAILEEILTELGE